LPPIIHYTSPQQQTIRELSKMVEWFFSVPNEKDKEQFNLTRMITEICNINSISNIPGLHDDKLHIACEPTSRTLPALSSRIGSTSSTPVFVVITKKWYISVNRTDTHTVHTTYSCACGLYPAKLSIQ